MIMTGHEQFLLTIFLGFLGSIIPIGLILVIVGIRFK